MTLEEQIARKCIHFNGVMEMTCKAGVCYADVREEPESGPYKFPCLKQGGECGKAEFRTTEQVKANVEQIEGRGFKALIALAAIKDHYAKTKQQSGFVPCECGGDICYTIASLNDHVHAKCKSCHLTFNE
jgi:hypothetical protein